MAKFFRDAASNYGLRVTVVEETELPLPPGATVVEFDERTNQVILDSLSGRVPPFRWQDHAISGAQILRAGVPMAIAADSPEKQERSDFDAAFAAYVADLQAYLVIADTATAAQVREQTKRLSQGMLRVARMVKQLRRVQA